MSRLLIIPLALLTLIGLSIAWSGGATQRRADFTFINRGDIITLDPNQMSYLQDMRMAYAMWEGLYTYHPITLAPLPGVARSHELSDDHRVYTFRLRPEARWSDGSPVTAHDFVFAWRRMLESPGEYTYLFYYIKGAEQYLADYQAYLKARRDPAMRDAARRPDLAAAVGIEPLDDHTLRVRLDDPVTFFLDLMAFPPFLPLHEPSMRPFARVDGVTGHTDYDTRFTRPPGVVTNGPFRLVQWDFKRRLRLEANEHYWDAANVRSRSMEMVVVDDPLGQLFRYESGDVDWLAEVPSEVAADLYKMGRPDLRNFSGFGTTFLTLNVNPRFNDGSENPLADERVRHALAMSIQKAQITETITRMGERPATTYIPPGIFNGYQSTPGHAYDPARAKQLLAESGKVRGSRLPGVSLLFRAGNAVSKEIAQNLKKQWRDNLGIDVPLEMLESKIARQRLNTKDYAIASANWIGDYNDPSTFTDKYRSTSENNDSAWKNPEYDRLVQAATKETDPGKRLRLLEQAERLLNEEAPIIPLFHLTNQYLFRDNVKGINTNPRNMTMFKGVYIER